MTFLPEKWFEDVRIGYHRAKGYQVPQMNGGRGLHGIRLILFRASVAQSRFLLVIEPVLVIGPETGIEHPLLETQSAALGITRVLLPIRPSRVPGEVRMFRDLVAPFSDQLLRFAGENLTRRVQPSFV